MIIREERAGDAEQIRTVNLAAFDTRAEADLVDALRRGRVPAISLVAEDNATLIGHILFSPVTIVGAEALPLTLVGLAPMAVVPARQRQGVGSHLVVEGLERCRRANVAAVVVLGHPDYYPRFGFTPASGHSIRPPFDVEDQYMMALVLDPTRPVPAGTIRYPAAFGV